MNILPVKHIHVFRFADGVEVRFWWSEEKDYWFTVITGPIRYEAYSTFESFSTPTELDARRFRECFYDKWKETTTDDS